MTAEFGAWAWRELRAMTNPQTGKRYTWAEMDRELGIKEESILHMTRGTSLTLDQTCIILHQLLKAQPTKGKRITKAMEAIEQLAITVMKAKGIPLDLFPTSLFTKVRHIVEGIG